MIDHSVHGRADAEELPLYLLSVDLQLDLLRQIAFGHGLDHPRDLRRRLNEVGDQAIDRIHGDGPLARRGTDRRAVSHLSFAADGTGDTDHLVRQPIVPCGDVVERDDQIGHQRVAVRLQADREVASVHRPKTGQQPRQGTLARRAALRAFTSALGRLAIVSDLGGRVLRRDATIGWSPAPPILAAASALAVAAALLGSGLALLVEIFRSFADSHGQLLAIE